MLRTFLRTIPRSLNLLALVALLLLCMKVFVANRIPEAFSGAYEFGVVVEGLLASVLASYIFYLIVVHVKETTDRRLIYPRVIGWSKLLVGDALSQLTAISAATNAVLTLDNITPETVRDAFTRLNPNGQAPLLLGPVGNQYATWRQYFSHYRSRSKENATRIMTQLVFLEAELVALVASIDDSTHFRLVETTASLPMGNADATFFAEHFFTYCSACRSLQQYIERNG